MWPNYRRYLTGRHSTGLCDRCGQQQEDEGHRSWQCCKNRESLDPAIKATQDLCTVALGDPQNQVFWCRGIPPRTMYPTVPPPPVITVVWGQDKFQCEGFQKIFVDGSGWKHSRDRRLRRVGSAFVIPVCGDPEEVPRAAAGGIGSVPGAQTVPRAELLAVILVLELCRGDLHIITDCLYVSKWAQRPPSREKVFAASNGDLWHRYWTARDAYQGRVRWSKIAAHQDALALWSGVVNVQLDRRAHV